MFRIERDHFEHAVLQPVGHVDCVRERKLLHPRRLPVELEPAGGPRRRRISPGFDQLPVGIRRQKSVDRNRAANVAERHVERIAHAVGVERLLVEAVRPRPEERNPAHRRFGLEVLDRRVGPPQHVRALDLHFEGHVADRQRDRHGVAGFWRLRAEPLARAASRIALDNRGRQRPPSTGAERRRASIVHRYLCRALPLLYLRRPALTAVLVCPCRQ